VATALHGPLGEDDESWLATLGDARVTEASAGMSGSLGDARWRVLWPTGSRAVPEGNDASVVVEFAGGGVPGILLLGDLSSAAQSALRATGALAPEYPVVKVSHHGSADQDPGLYAQISPRIAIFSAGLDNDYGHPRTESIAVTEAAGALSVRTDLQGRILIGLDGTAPDDAGELVVWTERADSPTETADVDDPE
jgi:competence protein ComEC